MCIGKVLAQGNNNKQRHPGIEPGSSESHAGQSQTTAAAVPHKNYSNKLECMKLYHYTGAYKTTIHLSCVTIEPLQEPFLFAMGDWVRVDFDIFANKRNV